MSGININPHLSAGYYRCLMTIHLVRWFEITKFNFIFTFSSFTLSGISRPYEVNVVCNTVGYLLVVPGVFSFDLTPNLWFMYIEDPA